MSPHRTLAFAAIVLCLRPCLPAACGKTSGPSIHFLSNTWDFGRAVQGQTLTHEFQYENRGTKLLEIGMIRASCSSCTGAVAGSKVIAPGKKGVIKVTFRTARMAGPQHKRLIVHSNAANAPFVELLIKGVVSVGGNPAIAVAPESWDLGVVKPGRPRRVTLTVSNAGDKPLEIKSVQLSPACAWVNRAAGISIGRGKSANLALTIDPTRLKGVIQEYVYIQSNDPVRPTQVVQIMGYAATGLSPTQAPDCVTIGLDPERVPVPGSGRSFARRLSISSGLGQPITVRAAAGSQGVARLAEASVQVLPGRVHKANLELVGDKIAPDKDGYVYITIGIPVLTKQK